LIAKAALLVALPIPLDHLYSANDSGKMNHDIGEWQGWLSLWSQSFDAARTNFSHQYIKESRILMKKFKIV
jgi:hypothetical protein